MTRWREESTLALWIERLQASQRKAIEVRKGEGQGTKGQSVVG